MTLERRNDSITARGLNAYTTCLHFDPALLEGQNVMNFGSGGSRIGKELEKNRVSSRVVDVDLQVTGGGNFFWRLRTIGNLLGVDDKSRLGKKLNSMHAKSACKEGRSIIRADGRSLPFKDKAFDTVLALASTYQIPYGDRELVFRELMRVGNTIHCGPIYESDFRILRRLSEEDNFDIIACLPFGKGGGFVANSPRYYQEYKQKYSAEQRIKPPVKESSWVFFGVLGKSVIYNGGGSYIVLQKKP